LARAKSNRRISKTEENIKAIIDCLKKRRMGHGDLQKATGIAPRTLSRMLGYLEYWELAAKDKTGQWAWFERIRTYDTRQDLDVSVNHSKELIKGLNLFMASLTFPERFSGTERGLDSTDKRILKEAAEEHLRTGYEELYGEIAGYRNLVIRREDLAGEIGRLGGRDGIKLLTDIFHFRNMKSIAPKKEGKHLEKLIENIPGEKLAAIDEIERSRIDRYNRLSGAVEYLIKKIENYEPLEGRCTLCPKVKVSSN
jgi:hypothetical protein